MISILTDTLCAVVSLLPSLHFETTEIRLDTLHEDDAAVIVHFPFTVQAAGTISESGGPAEMPAYGSVTLENLWASCSCTRLHDYPQEALNVGDSGQISVRFSPAGQRGEVLRTVAVYCKEQPAKLLEELLLTAYVLPPRDPFYHYPIRRDPLRLMQDRLSMTPAHRRATLLLANVHPTDTLLVYADRLPEGIAAPAEEAPVRVAPGSTAGMPFSLTGAADTLSVPQVRTLTLRWKSLRQEPVLRDIVGNCLPVELLITSR